MTTILPASELIKLGNGGLMPVNDSGSTAEAFRSILENIHTDTSTIEIGKGGVNADKVQAAKDAMLPSPWKTSSTTSTADGIAPLRASFDHALMVTLVSQVISGVGQSVNTLIRQQ